MSKPFEGGAYRRARFLSQQARYAPLPYPTNQVDPSTFTL